MKVIILSDKQHEALVSMVQLYAAMQEDRRGMPSLDDEPEMVKEELFIQECERMNQLLSEKKGENEIIHIATEHWPTESDALWAWTQRKERGSQYDAKGNYTGNVPNENGWTP